MEEHNLPPVTGPAQEEGCRRIDAGLDAGDDVGLPEPTCYHHDLAELVDNQVVNLR